MSTEVDKGDLVIDVRRGHAFAMWKRKDLRASLDGMEIGAVGLNRLQFVLDAEGRRVIVGLQAAEARWLASALVHWAESSEAISSVKPVP